MLEAFEQGACVTAYVSRVSHAEAYLVIAGNMHEDALREGGEIRADIEPVAGAVLPGQLDFGASVGHKALDLLDDSLGGIAFEPPLHEVRAAERAGVEATFLDVYDTHERGFA